MRVIAGREHNGIRDAFAGGPDVGKSQPGHGVDTYLLRVLTAGATCGVLVTGETVFCLAEHCLRAVTRYEYLAATYQAMSSLRAIHMTRLRTPPTGSRTDKFTELAPGLASDLAGPEDAKPERTRRTWRFRNGGPARDGVKTGGENATLSLCEP